MCKLPERTTTHYHNKTRPRARKTREEMLMTYHSNDYFCEWWPTEVTTSNSSAYDSRS